MGAPDPSVDAFSALPLGTCTLALLVTWVVGMCTLAPLPTSAGPRFIVRHEAEEKHG